MPDDVMMALSAAAALVLLVAIVAPFIQKRD
jgi:hypothetical protein